MSLKDMKYTMYRNNIGLALYSFITARSGNSKICLVINIHSFNIYLTILLINQKIITYMDRVGKSIYLHFTCNKKSLLRIL